MHSLCSTIVKVNRFISEIFSADWLMERQAAKSYLPMLANILEGNTEAEFELLEPKGKTFDVSAAGNSYTVYGPNTTGQLLADPNIKDATVIVPVQDAITKNDSWCSYGSMTWAKVVETLSASDKVSTIVFNIDSPGGSVAGTQTFADAILASEKKTIAHINEGMAASAAYWIASSCDEIYATKSTDAVGSIGVYVTLADIKKYWETKGLVIKEVYSRHSSEKNKIYEDAINGEEDALKDRLDFIAELFIDHVKANRTIDTSVADPFKGAMFFAEEAQSIGLIDGIKTLDQVIESSTAPTQTNIQISAMKISEQIAILNSAESTEEQRAEASAAIQAAFDADEVITQEEVDAAVATATEGMSTAEEVESAVATATEPLATEITALKKQLSEPTTPAGDEAETEEQFGGKKVFKPIIT